MKTESFLMRFFKRNGLDSIAWSLRRIYCPVKKTDLVLEVGSGGNPYFRANILCDAYFETQERFFVPLIYDRPTIIASAENLPFKNDAFDFVIASHVLEHSTNPKKFLEEIQRVGKAGYIEVPDAFMERLTHYTFHRTEITERNGELLIRKKKNFIQDKELVELFDYKASRVFPELISRHPFHFHVRYYWRKDEGGIRFGMINPEYKFDWDFPVTNKNVVKNKFNLNNFLKKQILLLLRILFSQNKRNKDINIIKLMMCNKCKENNSIELNKEKASVNCRICGEKYVVYGIKNNSWNIMLQF
ncbi:MAG: class I SAM-dependent methyltransferase [Patescibacteria group bacterium]